MLICPRADIPTETIGDLLKVGSILNKQEEGIFFFLTPVECCLELPPKTVFYR